MATAPRPPRTGTVTNFRRRVGCVPPIYKARVFTHMEALQALMRKKDALEAEAESLTEQLSASNMGGTSGPLVDREGFPRADVDVHATRLLRNRLACLNTDHRELMGLIERSMHALHSAAAASGTVSTGSAPAARSTPTDAPALSGSAAPALSTAVNGHTDLKPFALVDSVDPAGPAATAGLQVGDRLLRFGGLHAENHDQLKALGRLTQRSSRVNAPPWQCPSRQVCLLRARLTTLAVSALRV